MRSLGRAGPVLVHEVMGSPFFARPHAHGHFPSIAQLPPLSTSLCTSSDCDHPSGNRSISCPRESPDSSPTSGSSAERAGDLPPSLLPSSSSTTRGWSSPISSVGVALLLRSVGRGVRYQSRSFWQRRKTDRRRRRTLRRGGGCSGRAGKAAARSLARSFATCESAVGEQIAERKEERPRE